MTIEENVTTNGSDDDGYRQALASVQAQFATAIGPLFTTDRADLFDVFLNHLPHHLRQHYTCNACRHFFKRYAGLATVVEGRLVPAMWPAQSGAGLLEAAMDALYRAVATATISGVFFSDQKVWGIPQTGVWQHFAVEPRSDQLAKPGVVKTLEALAAEKREERLSLERGLAEFPADVLRRALALLDKGGLERPEKGAPMARWLLQLQERLQGLEESRRRNSIWAAVMEAPGGFCHVRSGVLGTLLEDVVANLDVEAIRRRWAEKLDPARYQRLQVAPAAGNLQLAEALIAGMAAAGALRRRYARRADIQEYVWQARPKGQGKPAAAGGVFTHIEAKKKTPAAKSGLELPEAVMTLQKFLRTILPTAAQIEFQVPAGRTIQLAAIVTAADRSAPPILQWDRYELRNPASIYSQQAAPSRWNLNASWVEVKFITSMPYHWHGNQAPQHKAGLLLALEGCRDLYRKQGGGFLPEFLLPELREIRASLDAYARSASVEGMQDAEACGVALMQSSSVAAARSSVAESTVILVLDESGSMSHHSAQMRRQAEVIRATLAARLPRSKIELCRFGSQPHWEPPTRASQLAILRAGGSSRGGTSLYYTLTEAARRAVASSDPVLLYLLTDGRNESNLGSPVDAQAAVAAALETGRVTFGCVGPAEAANFFCGCGIPSACVRSWSTEQVADLDSVTEQVANGINAFADALAEGRMGIEDFFGAPTSGFGDGVPLRVTTEDGHRQVVVLDRWD